MGLTGEFLQVDINSSIGTWWISAPNRRAGR
jgi:hypothetical protein